MAHLLSSLHPQLHHFYPCPQPSISLPSNTINLPKLTIKTNPLKQSLRRDKVIRNHYAFSKHKHQPEHDQHQDTFLWGIFTNRWWADLKGALGQRFNLEGIICSSKVITTDQHLLLPHLTVPDIRWIDWPELRRRGFKGVIFDKDNTITLPYSLTPLDSLKPCIDLCKVTFGEDNVAVFSNSAGLAEFDPDESKARAVEREIGLRVVRHRVKKPAGDAEEIERQIGCRVSEIVIVGDRRFTDVVYGNRNGFFTVLTEPLSDHGEPFVVRFIRWVEGFLVENWWKNGVRPVDHVLLPNCDAHLVNLEEPL